MDTNTPDHGIYLGDLAQTIKDIDGRVFHSIGRPYCEIILLNEFPGPKMPGSHIAKLVTFTAKTPIIYSPSVLMFPAKQECHIIWGTNVSDRLDYMLRRNALSSIGDRDIKELWFMIAVALARLRVLFREEWFKDVQLRTRRSVLCYREFFFDGCDEVGSLRKLLFEFDSDAKNLLLVQNYFFLILYFKFS